MLFQSACVVAVAAVTNPFCLTIKKSKVARNSIYHQKSLQIPNDELGGRSKEKVMQSISVKLFACPLYVVVVSVALLNFTYVTHAKQQPRNLLCASSG